MACDGTPSVDLASRLAADRLLVRSAWPEAVERETVRGAGRTLAYASAVGRAPVVRLVVDPPNILLHFAEGAALPDPAGLLRGEGRRGRYVCLGAVRTEDQLALRILIGAAIAASSSSTEIDLDHQPGATG